MIRALYTASSGLVAQSAKQDIIANNIANAGTPGFRRMRTVTSSFAQTLASNLANVPINRRPAYPESNSKTTLVGVQSEVDTSEGSIHETGNTLDFAIVGPGEFEISTPNGIRTTRNGNFQVNGNGELCTSDGEAVNGQSGPIKIPKGQWGVKTDGTIFANGKIIDKINIVGEVAGKTTIRQGSLEGTNVNIVSEMVGMITNMRGFEANQKVITSVDQTLDKLINEAGRV